MAIEFGQFGNLALIFFIIGGSVALYLGSDLLCRGAVSLSQMFRVPPLIIGLTIVSMATSMAEFMISLYSALIGTPGIAIGNILGSNMTNMGLIFGIAALISPMTIDLRLVRKEMPLLLGATLIFSLLCFWNGLSRTEGIILLILQAIYFLWLFRTAKTADVHPEKELPPRCLGCIFQPFSFILLGCILLSLATEVMVNSALELGHRYSLSEAFLGITVIAIGTSLPELATTLLAAIRRQHAIAAGNIIGSNFLNMFLVGGGVATIVPFHIDRKLFVFEFPILFAITTLTWIFLTTKRKLERWEGATLLLSYATILSLLYYRQV